MYWKSIRRLFELFMAARPRNKMAHGTASPCRSPLDDNDDSDVSDHSDDIDDSDDSDGSYRKHVL